MATFARYPKIKIENLDPRLVSILPETYAMLISSNLTVHPSVASIILHGSRGLANRFKPESDIDLSLVANKKPGASLVDTQWLKEVWDATYSQWHSVVELDLAVVYDLNECGLACFDQTAWNDQICKKDDLDCFGLYKLNKGFTGLISNAGIQVKLMYPCLKIWERSHELY